MCDREENPLHMLPPNSSLTEQRQAPTTLRCEHVCKDHELEAEIWSEAWEPHSLSASQFLRPRGSVGGYELTIQMDSSSRAVFPEFLSALLQLPRNFVALWADLWIVRRQPIEAEEMPTKTDLLQKFKPLQSTFLEL